MSQGRAKCRTSCRLGTPPTVTDRQDIYVISILSISIAICNCMHPRATRCAALHALHAETVAFACHSRKDLRGPTQAPNAESTMQVAAILLAGKGTWLGIWLGKDSGT